jgi:hypothetical protein
MCLWCPWCTSKDDNEVAIHSCDDNLVVYYCDCDGRQKIRKTATYTNCGPLLHNPIEGHGRHSEMVKLHVCKTAFFMVETLKGMGHTDQSGESVPRPWRWRGWSRHVGRYAIYQWGRASLLQICSGVVFMPSAPLQTKISLQYSSQSPSTDPWPLFPLEACKALDNLQVVQKKIWDSARGKSRDRRVLDAEFVMFQSFFAGLLLRSQKHSATPKLMTIWVRSQVNISMTFWLWTWAVLRPTSTSVNCRCWSRRSQNIFDIDSKKPLRGNADLAVVSYRIVGSVMMSHYCKRLKSHESWEEHHRGLRL